MGVVNVTPDSFSDGGEFFDAKKAIAHGRELIEAGADVLDIGGESTRPGSEAVSAEEELRRIAPVVEGLAGTVPVSIDTNKASVAAAAIDRGASIVNDVTGLRSDESMAPLCAERGVEVVLMHMLGTPRTMQNDPTYVDVVSEVGDFLLERVEFAASAGIRQEKIWIDPGIGFGKTLEHNLSLLAATAEFARTGLPVLVGPSRKAFIGKIDGSAEGDRLGGTIAACLQAMAGGAGMVRVHDVAPVVQAIRVAEAIAGDAAGPAHGR
ncbi:MAG: dihydropteroate synthase [Solirubrobacterales bacterium]|nr:dihydropteroate synthase [Solirubrobacterales bacterium]